LFIAKSRILGHALNEDRDALFEGRLLRLD
jgi:hypothetical protein